MSLQTVGTWAAGVWAEDTWAECVWWEDVGCTVAAPPATQDPAPDSQGGGAAWPGRQFYKDKKHKQAILDDDEELMRIIALSLPELLNRTKKM